MKTTGIWAIAVALLIMAAVDLYESPEMVCARKRDRALEQFAAEPMNKSRYRVHLVESLKEHKGRQSAPKLVPKWEKELANFDQAYQQYLKNHASIARLASARIEKKHSACRGDWKLK